MTSKASRWELYICMYLSVSSCKSAWWGRRASTRCVTNFQLTLLNTLICSVKKIPEASSQEILTDRVLRASLHIAWPSLNNLTANMLSAPAASEILRLLLASDFRAYMRRTMCKFGGRQELVATTTWRLCKWSLLFGLQQQCNVVLHALP
jgi:hypothetical protein